MQNPFELRIADCEVRIVSGSIRDSFWMCLFALLVSIFGAGCVHRASTLCETNIPDRVLVPPAEPACANDALTGYGSLLVIAPHPDDETLGFAGLITAYRDQGKPVKVLVSTDGDAYCDACRFWKNSSTSGSTCNASDLSNFASSEIDSFGEVRRGESTSAAKILGLPPPTFLGYPDTGLRAAWDNLASGEPYKPLRRSDFSMCADCKTCDTGYGGGPETSLTASTLLDTLRQKISSTPEDTLLATTHWLDGHGDHSSLGRFVLTLNASLERPRPIAFAVIHAHTPKNTSHPDCWYPGPQALVCPCDYEQCTGQDPTWIANLRKSRFHPDWPAMLPDDADYGESKQLCLPQKLYEGEAALKTQAVQEYKSQLGFLARNGGAHPDSVAGIIDCNGYLISFVKRTEAFVLMEPARNQSSGSH